MFALDTVQAAAAQAAAFGADFASNVFGLSASVSDASGGFETEARGPQHVSDLGVSGRARCWFGVLRSTGSLP